MPDSSRVAAAPAPLRVLLVTHYYSTHRGGVELVAHRLADALARAGEATIEWIASDCDPPPTALPPGVSCTPAASWNGVERASGLPYPLWSPRAIAALRRAVQSCDIVHLHDSLYMGNVLAAVFARRQRKPLVVTQHTGPVPQAGALRALVTLLNRSVGRWILSGASQAIFISPAVQDYFARFCAFRSAPAYVPNGVDAQLFSFVDAAQARELRRAAGRDPSRPLCVFVGRFVAAKGIELVLSIARQRPQTDWIIAGDGPLEPERADLANVSVLRGRAGKEIAALYQMADLLVLPSRREGFPLVVQEAMACGTPALVTSEIADGCPPLKRHLFTAELQGADAAERWGRRVMELLREPADLRASRAKFAQAALAIGSWGSVAQAYADAFRRFAHP